MAEDWSPIDPKAVMAAALAKYLDAIGPLREATMGYRNSLVEQGMNPEAADSCAADFHQMLIKTITEAVKK